MALLFRSKAGADVFMLQADAERLLQALGRDAAAQGIFLPEQVEAAEAQFARRLAELRAAAEMQDKPADPADLPPDAAAELARRAWPLLELLRAARARGVPVTWSSA